MRKNGIFYGWINLIALWFCYMLILGTITYSFGIMVSEMSAGLGISITLASGGYTGYSLSQALLSPLLGSCAKRYGAKVCIIIGSLSMAAGCFIMAFAAKGLILYYIVWIVFLGVAVRFAASSACYININKWFFKKRGLAMAIFFTSGGLGGYIFTPLLTKVMELYSWRSVWVVMGICGLVATACTVLIIREDPADMGQQVDGGASASGKGLDISRFVPGFARAAKSTEPWTLSEVKREKTYYYLIFFQFLINFYMVSIGNFGISYMKTLGMTAAAAATLVSTYSFANIFGRLIVGAINDHVDSKYIFLISNFLMAVGLLCMMKADTPALGLLFSWVAGIGFGMFIVTPSNAIVNYFGNTNYSDIISSFGLISGVLCGFNSLIMGALCDLTGSTDIIWTISLTLVVIGLIVAAVMKPPVRRL